MITPSPIVLASASPRRQELLKKAGIDFVIHPAHIPEVPAPGEAPLAFGERMAREKAFAVYQSVPEAVVLGADTVVAVEDLILGKPENTDDAARMLRLLSGRTHLVITSVCLKTMLPMLFAYQLSATGGRYVAVLPDLRSELNHARSDLLVEIDSMGFQFFDFEEHFGTSAPPNMTAQAAEAY